MEAQDAPQGRSVDGTASSAPAWVELDALPDVSAFGSPMGRDGFHDLCRTLFAKPEVRFLRDDAGSIIVFRNHHLRELAVHPAAGNTPPQRLARGRFEQIRDPALTPAGTGAALVRTVTSQIFSMNGSLHDAARAILVAQLTPKAAARMTGLAARIVARLLDEAARSGELDFHQGFSERLAACFWGAFVGMSEDEMAQMPEHVSAMSAIFFAGQTEDDTRQFDLGTDRYATLVRDAARRTLAAGSAPALNAMADQLARLERIDEPERAGVTPPDIGDFLAGNLLDAFHTAALGVTNCVLAAACQPGLLERLRAEPDILPAATAEALRLEPPVLSLGRYALEDIVFDGVRIPAGAPIVMAWAAGNFDPEVFDRPFEFDLARSQRGASTFGSGAQICPGRIVAAMLVSQTLKAIADRGLELTFPDRIDWFERSAMAQVRTLPTQIRSTCQPARPEPSTHDS